MLRRLVFLILAAAAIAGTGSAWACPMQQSASKGQVVASSNGKAASTPIPAKTSQDSNG